MKIEALKWQLEHRLKWLVIERDHLRDLYEDIKDAKDHAEHATDCLEEAVECLSEIV